jgi:hypothetical protein
MRIGSYGIIFVVTLVIFVISMGIIALGNTDFVKGSLLENNMTDWASP